jgi:hypothetical protein
MGSRSKTAGKKNTKGSEATEKQPVNELPAQENMQPAEEKMFVQTIQIPKPGSVHKKAKRKPGARKPPSGGHS